MHLAELLARRPVPASGVFLALTRRCPLRCRHCSTMSRMTSYQQPAGPLLRFAESFSPADHPEFVLFTGGEPLLRPGLVRALAATARARGSRSYLLTGAFFARSQAIPAPIRAALQSVDHVAVSMDVFHEAQVPRRQVFRLLHTILDSGTGTSVQACGSAPGDPYLAELTGQVRREFGDRVPMLVTTVRAAGRARSWRTEPALAAAVISAAAEPGPLPRAAPCDMAAWPVVGFDGAITACCHPDVVDAGTQPSHLRLGHIADTTWPQVRRACVSSPVLRGLRTEGPVRLAYQAGAPAGPSYCGTCRSLAERPDVLRRAEVNAARPALALIERQALALQVAAGPAGFARRHGEPGQAELVLLGWPGTARDPCLPSARSTGCGRPAAGRPALPHRPLPGGLRALLGERAAARAPAGRRRAARPAGGRAVRARPHPPGRDLGR